jgi:lipopolysaccharide transport system ATP-binding protein
MSSDIATALTVRDLGKSYRLFDRPQDRLKQGFWRRRKYYREFWALRDVSFSVKKGETVGIVGRNGSGKSTLLQIIAGTLAPTSGRLEISGRISALLELGTGFNPDFTGRENVFLNASILGLSRAETERHFQDIVDFAEIGEFIDQPVRTYSSGMLVRLAFAVHAVVPKDVLIVDEILSVGDEAFQRKCFAKLEEFREQGGTVLLVSHEAGLVIQLCDRALLLEDGDLLLQGECKRVVHLYQQLVHAPVTEQEELRREIRNLGSIPDWENASPSQAPDRQRRVSAAAGVRQVERRGMYDPELVSKHVVRYKSRGARIEDPHLTMLDGSPVNLLRARELYVWRYRVTFEKPFQKVRFGMLIKTVSGMELGGRVTAPDGRGISEVEAGTTIEAQFSFRANLVPGTYFLNAGLVAALPEGPEGEVYVDRWVDACMFKVMAEEEQLVTGFVDFGIEPHLTIEGKRLLVSLQKGD